MNPFISSLGREFSVCSIFGRFKWPHQMSFIVWRSKSTASRHVPALTLLSDQLGGRVRTSIDVLAGDERAIGALPARGPRVSSRYRNSRSVGSVMFCRAEGLPSDAPPRSRPQPAAAKMFRW